MDFTKWRNAVPPLFLCLSVSAQTRKAPWNSIKASFSSQIRNGSGTLPFSQVVGCSVAYPSPLSVSLQWTLLSFSPLVSVPGGTNFASSFASSLVIYHYHSFIPHIVIAII